MWLLEQGDMKTLGVMQASKWLRFRVLFDEKSLKAWLDQIGNVCLVNLCSTTSKEDLHSSKEALLNTYSLYMDQLKKGEEIDQLLFQKKLSLHMTTDPDSCYCSALKNNTIHFAKERMPGIRISLHSFSWDASHHAIHSNVYAKSNITWGLEFSYPQIFAGSINDEVVYVLKSKTMPNNDLFTSLKRWIRRESKPVSFVYQGEAMISTLRLDKGAASWIDHHQGLKKHELKVKL